MKCKKCGTSENIHTHHVNVWRPGIRQDLSYGRQTISLCAQCHAWVHSYNNQDDEYLQVTKIKPTEFPDIKGISMSEIIAMSDSFSPFCLNYHDREILREFSLRLGNRL